MIRGKRFYSTKVFWGTLGLFAVAAVGLVHVQGGMVNLFSQIASADGLSPLRRFSSPHSERSSDSQRSTEQPIEQRIGPQIRQLEQTEGLSQDQILEKYQNFIYSLVTEENLKQLPKDDPVRTAAKDQTLDILGQLDGSNRGKLLKFLIESNLVSGDQPILSLYGANLNDVDFSNQSLSQVNLRGANLSDARLSQTDLSSGKLFGATIDRADLGFAELNQAELFRVSLKQSNLFLANLNGAILQEADLTGADLFLADLRHAKLNKTNLTRADLTFANLSAAELVFANLQDTALSRANLSEANLSGANLSRAVLQGADLRNADLSGANLRNADLSGANLTGANLAGADLTGAIQYNTTLPDGTRQP